MFEKLLITTLKSASAVVYIATMCMLFAFPVSFIVHAFLPPVFTLDKIEVSLTDDQEITPVSSTKTQNTTYRIDYHITASSGKFSPYEYTIDEITLQDDSILSFAEGYEVQIDKPSYFTKDIEDKMIISLYIDTNEEFDINEVCNSISFKTKVYEKGFGQFKVKYGNGNLWK